MAAGELQQDTRVRMAAARVTIVGSVASTTGAVVKTYDADGVAADCAFYFIAEAV